MLGTGPGSIKGTPKLPGPFPGSRCPRVPSPDRYPRTELSHEVCFPPQPPQLHVLCEMLLQGAVPKAGAQAGAGPCWRALLQCAAGSGIAGSEKIDKKKRKLTSGKPRRGR